MQEATVNALRYNARPPLGCTALKEDGKSYGTQVAPKHPDFSDVTAEPFSLTEGSQVHGLLGEGDN